MLQADLSPWRCIDHFKKSLNGLQSEWWVFFECRFFEIMFNSIHACAPTGHAFIRSILL